ncbi:MAG TPA: hypothetical protein VFO96_06970 [Gemmatimonadales bacterium]|jgi:hypothetical protein|nr:hypothetical protein [Gemmatimonadales bacterium]
MLRNALTRGAAWGVAGGVMVAALALLDPRPGIESLPERVGMALFAAGSWGVRFGLIGAVIGTAFAAVIRFGYQVFSRVWGPCAGPARRVHYWLRQSR